MAQYEAHRQAAEALTAILKASPRLYNAAVARLQELAQMPRASTTRTPLDGLVSILEWTADDRLPDDRKLYLIREAAVSLVCQPDEEEEEF